MRSVGLIIAIVVAALAAFLVLRFTGSPEPAPQPAPVVVEPQQTDIQTVNVYVASSFIPVGTRIDESMLDTQPWPSHLVVPGFVIGVDEGEKLIGKVTRSAFQPREPIIATKVINANDPNFIAGTLPQGMRMVTISTNVVDGLAGFVFPGDRVDVLVTHRVIREGVRQEDLKQLRDDEAFEEVTETLLTNVRVLAVDQRSSVTSEGNVIVPSTVSLQTTPEDAQRIRLASSVGQLSLTLRSLEDEDTLENIAATRKSSLSDTTGYTPGQTSSANAGSYIPVTVVRGTSVEDEEGLEKRQEQDFRSSMQRSRPPGGPSGY
ncbi:MAG: Flp pilus assembly protein CpaB [Rickettsiales bacterium]|nr:Flp pilus assembly protein CpaB [Rickettsiales bacterium]